MPTSPFVGALAACLFAVLVALFYSNVRLPLSKVPPHQSKLEGENQEIWRDKSPLDYSSLKQFTHANSERTLRWGTYRPGLYYGIRSRTYPYFLSAGLLWTSQHEDISQLRHLCRQEDRLQKYGWLEHDGKTYGLQTIEDQHNRVLIKSYYTRFLSNSDQVSGENTPVDGWGARFQLSHLEPKDVRLAKKKIKNTKLSLFFYFDLSCEDDSIDHSCRERLKDLLEVTMEPTACLQSDEKLQNACSSMQIKSIGMEKAAEEETEDEKKASETEDLLEFSAHVELRSKKPIKHELRFTGLKDTNILNVRDKIASLAERIDPDDPNNYDTIVYLDNFIEESSTIVVIQAIIDADASSFTAEDSVTLDIVLNEQRSSNEKRASLRPLGPLVDSKLAKDSKAFEEHFEKVFQLKKKTNSMFNASQIAFAKAAFSNLLGGMGFFYGNSLVQLDEDDDSTILQAGTKPLFTAVPSRSFFPRGFLWDEGFHQMGIAPFDKEISQDAIIHWLHLMMDDGYIPREQILGQLARSRVPSEFIVQHVEHANPPSIFLCLEKMLAASSKDEDDRKFFRLIFPFLQRWYQWLVETQRYTKSEAHNTFRWRGRNPKDGKLIANTLSSGLDDYPRATVPTDEEIHVDILSWMIKISDILAQIADLLGNEHVEWKGHLVNNKKLFLQALEKYHWNQELDGYFDYGLHSEDGRIESQVVVRCRNEQGAMKDTTAPVESVRSGSIECPETHPIYLYPLGDGQGGLKMQPIFIPKTTKLQHVPRVGYVSLFPLLLKLLPSDSNRLQSILRVLKDPEHLWSPYGLRSLSTRDFYYEQENAPGDNPYWRGSLWININYLALDALHHYAKEPGPYKETFEETYTALRQNVINTIYQEYERTGYLWEQYNGNVQDKAHYGKGQRCHPFSGWTALVVNIMAEKY